MLNDVHNCNVFLVNNNMTTCVSILTNSSCEDSNYAVVHVAVGLWAQGGHSVSNGENH